MPLTAPELTYDAILDASPIPTSVVDAKGIIVYVNDAFLAYAGDVWGREIRREERIGRNVWEFITPDWKEWEDLYDGVLKKGEAIFRPEVPVYVSPGREACIDIRANPLRGEDGQVLGAVMTYQNVTDRVHTQREERRRAALDRVRASVYGMREASDIQHVLAALYGALKDLGVEFDDCSVQVVDEKKERFGSYTLLRDRMILRMEISLTDNAVSEAWRHKRPIYRRDLEREDRYNERAGIRKGFDKDVRSVLDVPFSHGTIAINSVRADVFSERDIETLGMVAEVISEGYRRYADLVERRRAEETLRESEERYRLLFENMLDGFAYCRMLFEHNRPQDFIYLDVNSAFEKLTGLKNVVGRKVTEVIPGIRASHPELFEIYGRVALTGQSERFELYFEPLEMWLSISVYSMEKGYFVAVFDNITKRRRAEEALRRNQALLQDMERVTRVGGWEYDVAAKRITWTDGVYRIYGVSPEAYDPNNIPEDISFYAPEDQAAIARAFQRTVEQGEPYDLELGFTSLTGQKLWVRTIGQADVREGRVVRVYGNIMDITERKRADMALRESEERMKLALDGTDEGLWDWDVVSGAITLSDNWVRILGYTPGEMEFDFDWWERSIHPDSGPVFEAALNDYLEGREKYYGLEYQIKDGSGEWRWVWARGICVAYGAQGEPLRMIGTHRDIAQRKQAEAEVRQRADEMTTLHRLGQQISASLLLDEVIRAALEEIAVRVETDAAILFLREGDRLLLKELLVHPPGLQEKEIPVHQVGQCLCGIAVGLKEAVFSGDIREDARCQWEECKKAGYASFAALPLRSGEDVIGVLGLACKTRRDFSAQSEFLTTIAATVGMGLQNALLYEQIQRHAAELEERVAQRTAQLQTANKDLESFSYSVSHDLRAPLRAINGFAAIIARRHRADLNEEGRHYVDNIVQASERMGHLIDDLLQYSRLGRTGVRREPVSLHEVCAPLVSDLAARLAEIGGTLKIPEDVPTVMGDKTLLRQIFANLLDNALTYRKPDVPLQVRVTCQTEGNDVIIGVCDNGIGIPSEHHERIFNLFQRLQSEEAYPGTGIGLANVRKSVALLGGRVWVESVVGGGSTFFVKLPKE